MGIERMRCEAPFRRGNALVLDTFTEDVRRSSDSSEEWQTLLWTNEAIDKLQCMCLEMFTNIKIILARKCQQQVMSIVHPCLLIRTLESPEVLPMPPFQGDFRTQVIVTSVSIMGLIRNVCLQMRLSFDVLQYLLLQVVACLFDDDFLLWLLVVGCSSLLIVLLFCWSCYWCAIAGSFDLQPLPRDQAASRSSSPLYLPAEAKTLCCPRLAEADWVCFRYLVCNGGNKGENRKHAIIKCTVHDILIMCVYIYIGHQSMSTLMCIFRFLFETSVPLQQDKMWWHSPRSLGGWETKKSFIKHDGQLVGLLGLSTFIKHQPLSTKELITIGNHSQSLTSLTSSFWTIFNINQGPGKHLTKGEDRTLLASRSL